MVYKIEIFLSRYGSVKEWRTNPCITVHENKARRFLTKRLAVKYLMSLFPKLSAEMRDGWIIRRYKL